ncbi:2-oxoglutarate dehydrogenase, mitochondrial [Symbiodinium microadriaticum]|uniref:2-oxoglutarate dehydrogenase, mitochondrial n=1 Tax=Symbiodinium microadriaticum TaxID=2951 RepID=A0A1Q9D0P9_SYMMI|nr:2-oxoglutarate dehydrogenase, mitochondrial [Symbiodinium microadriaticum]
MHKSKVKVLRFDKMQPKETPKIKSWTPMQLRNDYPQERAGNCETHSVWQAGTKLGCLQPSESRPEIVQRSQQKQDPLGRCRGSLARSPDWWREEQGHVMERHPPLGRSEAGEEGGPWWTREELLRVLEAVVALRRGDAAASATSMEKAPAFLPGLLRATLLTQFLRSKFPATTKWFGLDGSEARTVCGCYCPAFSAFATATRSAARGVEQIEMGMPHRGRLNILANILGNETSVQRRKELSQICCEMREDRKYHTGYVGELPTLEAWWHERFGATDSDHLGESVRSPVVTIAPNPSHLEMVTPVVLGKDLAETPDRGLQSVMGIVLHGDAAFAGSGMAFEALQWFSELPGYGTGGTVHVVLNNQVGYTTTPNEAVSKSWAFCSLHHFANLFPALRRGDQQLTRVTWRRFGFLFSPALSGGGRGVRDWLRSDGSGSALAFPYR